MFYWVGRVAGQQTRAKLGPFPKLSVAAARREASRANSEAAVGDTPKVRVTVSRDEWTLGRLHQWYGDTHGIPHTRSWKKSDATFTNHLSQWSNRKVSRVTTDDLAALHITIGEKHPSAANRVLELVRQEFRRGFRMKKITVKDPTAGIIRFPKTERERYLDDTELPKFLAEVDKLLHEVTRDFFRLALFIGARRSNIAAMRWDELRLESRKWIIPKAKAKSKKDMVIVLSEQAMEILLRRHATKTSEYVLPSRSRTGHVVEPKHAMKRILERAGLSDVRFHDLRRTLGSWMAASGVSLPVIGKMLGHASPNATKVYARMNLDPVQKAINAVTTAMVATSALPEKKSE